jgi:hypothetical protein
MGAVSRQDINLQISAEKYSVHLSVLSALVVIRSLENSKHDSPKFLTILLIIRLIFEYCIFIQEIFIKNSTFNLQPSTFNLQHFSKPWQPKIKP